MIQRMIRRCGRTVCPCSLELLKLKVKIPVSDEEQKSIQKEYYDSYKKYIVCKNSYKSFH